MIFYVYNCDANSSHYQMASNVLQNEYYSSFINEIWRWQQDKLQGTIEKLNVSEDQMQFYFT